MCQLTSYTVSKTGILEQTICKVLGQKSGPKNHSLNDAKIIDFITSGASGFVRLPQKLIKKSSQIMTQIRNNFS